VRERFTHQSIGSLAAFLGFEIVRLVEIDGIDFRLVDKLENLDCPGQLNVRAFQIFIRDLDVLIFFVSYPRVTSRHFLVSASQKRL
jgi:hypothetical protein